MSRRRKKRKVPRRTKEHPEHIRRFQDEAWRKTE